MRLAGGHAVGAALGMTGFDEDDLYGNLDWLADNQADIESRLFARREAASALDVFLYDVTSTYLEGEPTPSRRSATTAIASRAKGRS